MAPPARDPAVRLFATDLDGTIIGNPESTHRWAQTWLQLPDDRRPLLVYNSGRLVEEIVEVIEEHHLPEPDYCIGGVGTEIVDFRAKAVIAEYQDQQFDTWDHEAVERVVHEIEGLERQPNAYQTAWKTSWYLPNASRRQVADVRKALKKAGLDVKVIYSANRFLDVVPRKADKGAALRWLISRLGVRANQVVVSGDTGNDVPMFKIRGVRGIVVENAQPELNEAVVKLPVYHSEGILADGVLQGLAHFGVCDESATVTVFDEAAPADRELEMLFDASALEVLDAGEQFFLDTAYTKAMDALRRNITPMGFSACSIDDNESTGVDVNYYSVWARDGGVTVAFTKAVDDPDVRRCQRATLATLLDACTPAGQIPANVRIATKEPDYSGVGGICSIDSGLWVVIAVYHYVTASGDLDFLEQYGEVIDRAMFWLGCHDSNNDGLLEIPEASDWTDLFGRSYQVLYDEVLWYRANVCYARLLEIRAEYDRAVEVLQRSQYIQGKLLATFWPSTSPSGDPKFAQTFADRQYGLGDVQYLLAEVTPFNFSWRCDVYGNLLAFLTNLIDVQKARTAFRFMWGSGVNQPWPVSNLYPVVQSGDPDWRPYYTVNLLNLPNHYHNGGIWPLIGGMWVRFIERLGQHEVACHELVRLAELCRLGRGGEWEFNEWAHGETGQPMGKAYQAWSAASFIRACHELGAGPQGMEPETGLYCIVPRK